MRYRLRTLLILLAIGPPVVAALGPPLVCWLQPDQIIHSTIAPQSWDYPGGVGSIQGFDSGCILIVSEDESGLALQSTTVGGLKK